MRVNLVKVCKASNARKLAFAYLSRSHGRRRRQKASAAAKVRKARKRKNLFLHFLAEATDVVDVKVTCYFDMAEPY